MALSSLFRRKQIDPQDEGEQDTQMKLPAIAIAGVTMLDHRLFQHADGDLVPTESATLVPNENASVCFHDPGSIRYAVKMKSATPSEEINVSGLIHIGASPSKNTGALSAPGAIPAP